MVCAKSPNPRNILINKTWVQYHLLVVGRFPFVIYMMLLISDQESLSRGKEKGRRINATPRGWRTELSAFVGYGGCPDLSIIQASPFADVWSHVRYFCILSYMCLWWGAGVHMNLCHGDVLLFLAIKLKKRIFLSVLLSVLNLIQYKKEHCENSKKELSSIIRSPKTLSIPPVVTQPGWVTKLVE